MKFHICHSDIIIIFSKCKCECSTYICIWSSIPRPLIFAFIFRTFLLAHILLSSTAEHNDKLNSDHAESIPPRKTITS